MMYANALANGSLISVSANWNNNQPAHSNNRHNSSFYYGNNVNSQPKVENGSHIVYNHGLESQNPTYSLNVNNISNVHMSHSQTQSNQGNGSGTANSNARQPTITIRDTPSPAVSVITISDSDDESQR